MARISKTNSATKKHWETIAYTPTKKPCTIVEGGVGNDS